MKAKGCSKFYTWTTVFLIYINDLSDDVASNPKLFAGDTSLFSVVENKTQSANKLNNNLLKISTSAFQ